MIVPLAPSIDFCLFSICNIVKIVEIVNSPDLHQFNTLAGRFSAFSYLDIFHDKYKYKHKPVPIMVSLEGQSTTHWQESSTEVIVGRNQASILDTNEQSLQR